MFSFFFILSFHFSLRRVYAEPLLLTFLSQTRRLLAFHKWKCDIIFHNIFPFSFHRAQAPHRQWACLLFSAWLFCCCCSFVRSLLCSTENWFIEILSGFVGRLMMMIVKINYISRNETRIYFALYSIRHTFFFCVRADIRLFISICCTSINARYVS